MLRLNEEVYTGKQKLLFIQIQPMLRLNGHLPEQLRKAKKDSNTTNVKVKLRI